MNKITAREVHLMKITGGDIDARRFLKNPKECLAADQMT
jgi:hypothetical protein